MRTAAEITKERYLNFQPRISSAQDVRIINPLNTLIITIQ